MFEPEPSLWPADDLPGVFDDDDDNVDGLLNDLYNDNNNDNHLLAWAGYEEVVGRNEEEDVQEVGGGEKEETEDEIDSNLLDSLLQPTAVDIGGKWGFQFSPIHSLIISSRVISSAESQPTESAAAAAAAAEAVMMLQLAETNANEANETYPFDEEFELSLLRREQEEEEEEGSSYTFFEAAIASREANEAVRWLGDNNNGGETAADAVAEAASSSVTVAVYDHRLALFLPVFGELRFDFTVFSLLIDTPFLQKKLLFLRNQTLVN